MIVCKPHLTQDFFSQAPQIHDISRPSAEDRRILALSAALVELFAERLNQTAPQWTTMVGALDEPIFLVKSALTMKRLRAV